MARKTVLLVDDETDFLELMKVRINEWGYEVITAADGIEAVSVFKKQSPDIIVLDYMMPGADGVGVLKEIRKMNKSIPVIMFTAHPDIKVIKDTEALGVSSFIPKLSVYQDSKDILRKAIEMAEKQFKK